MDILPHFVDMAMTPEERHNQVNPVMPQPSDEPIYPYGLCLSFTEKELAKLNIEDDAQVGDMIHMHAIGKVTSVSKRDTGSGSSCRIEIQLTAIAAEDEDAENDDAEESMEQQAPYRVDRSKFYR